MPTKLPTEEVLTEEPGDNPAPTSSDSGRAELNPDDYLRFLTGSLASAKRRIDELEVEFAEYRRVSNYLIGGTLAELLNLSEKSLKKRSQYGGIDDSSAGRAGQLDKRIECLDICVRGYNALRNSGAITLRDVVAMNPCQLLKLKNFGRKSLNDLERGLREFGLALQPIGGGQ